MADTQNFLANDFVDLSFCNDSESGYFPDGRELETLLTAVTDYFIDLWVAGSSPAAEVLGFRYSSIGRVIDFVSEQFFVRSFL